MQRQGAFKKQQETEGGIDLTPMLDVVFIMLIFFIVTASFVKTAGIDVDRPGAFTAEPKKNAKILIAVSANNEIWIDKNEIDKRAVKLHIERLIAENPKGAVVVQADNKSSAKAVATVLDAARDAGVADVSISAVRM